VKILFVLLLLVLFIFYANKINLTNSDIGRHIKNGELLLENHQILRSNFYSYTTPDFGTINHHWAYGGIVYLIWKSFGFLGISLFNIFFYLLTFIFIFKLAESKSNYWLALFFSVLMVPLIVYRKEVRPEVISYFFFAVYYFLLTQYKSREISFVRLFPLFIFMQILWVNTHLFFVFGIALVTFFTVDSFLNDKQRTQKFLGLLVAIVLASLINPYFLSGLLEPFTIFRSYGYLLAENVSIFFMQGRGFSWFYVYVEAMIFLGLVSFFIRKEFKKNIVNVLIFLFFGGLALNKIRGITLLGFVLIPILAENFKETFRHSREWQKDLFKYITLTIFILVSFVALNSLFGEGNGLGLGEGMQSSADFFVENNLRGNIFNNYDIGGYLIFNLFPEEKVFVDNRPEAYPVEFFRDIYIPMQEDDEMWKEYETKYEINIIYFYWHDMTPAGQDFMIKRLDDSEWVPVYVDSYALIYLKDNEQNREIIDKFRLPREIFSVKAI